MSSNPNITSNASLSPNSGTTKSTGISSNPHTATSARVPSNASVITASLLSNSSTSTTMRMSSKILSGSASTIISPNSSSATTSKIPSQLLSKSTAMKSSRTIPVKPLRTTPTSPTTTKRSALATITKLFHSITRVSISSFTVSQITSSTTVSKSNQNKVATTKIIPTIDLNNDKTALSSKPVSLSIPTRSKFSHTVTTSKSAIPSISGASPSSVASTKLPASTHPVTSSQISNKMTLIISKPLNNLYSVSSTKHNLATVTKTAKLDISSSPVPSTKSSKAPSTAAPTAAPIHPTKCMLCSGPPFICESRYHSEVCPDVTHQYCINDMTNNRDGTRTLNRRCATKDECEKDWWIHTSDRTECTSYDLSGAYAYSFKCSYCCAGNSCNSEVIPDKMYQGTT